jgi:hypothetical protein
MVSEAKRRATVRAVVNGTVVTGTLLAYPIPRGKRRQPSRTGAKACVVVAGRRHRIPPADVIEVIQ